MHPSRHHSALMEQVTKEDLKSLLEVFSRRLYRAKEHDSWDEDCHEKLVNLASKDYKFSIINNNNGELSTHYPNKMIILEKEKYEVGTFYADRKMPEIDSAKLRENIIKAKNARCRTRFPLPVLIYEGRSVCRSGTLSGGPEIYGRSGYDLLFSDHQSEKHSSECNEILKESNAKDSGNSEADHNSCNNVPNKNVISKNDSISIEKTNENNKSHLNVDNKDSENEESLYNKSDLLEEIAVPQNKTEWQLFTKVRTQDIRLLKFLNVQYIIDLMVEKKKVKFGINVTSSEKVDKENRYADFTIFSLPYPGCEFFKMFRDKNYSAEDLVFDWNQSFVDAKLDIPHDCISSHIRIDWTNYKKWDLIVLTKNYMKLILRYLAEGKSGMLIHCISGWDRTPLFVSLLRLSLWADGKIHSSLGPYEILYFTLAYDWYFFGHNLVDRLEKGEEILLFLFFVLKYFTSDQFSIQYIRARSLALSRTESDLNMESVLLESSYEIGSNTSLNSVDSTASNKSSVEGAAVNFSVGSSNITDVTISSTIRNTHLNSRSPSNRLGDTSVDNSQLDSSTDTLIAESSSTQPVPVPSNRKSSDANCGSWQMISGAGSVFGSAHMSIGSSILDSSSINNTSSGDGSSDQSFETGKSFGQFPTRCRRPSTPRTRSARLNSVRDLFYSLYSVTIGFHQQTADGSSIVTIFEHMAEKIGIRASKPSPI